MNIHGRGVGEIKMTPGCLVGVGDEDGELQRFARSRGTDEGERRTGRTKSLSDVFRYWVDSVRYGDPCLVWLIVGRMRVNTPVSLESGHFYASRRRTVRMSLRFTCRNDRFPRSTMDRLAM